MWHVTCRDLALFLLKYVHLVGYNEIIVHIHTKITDLAIGAGNLLNYVV